MDRIHNHIETELVAAEKGRLAESFYHLERAHVLGQTSTQQHTRRDKVFRSFCDVYHGASGSLCQYLFDWA